MQLPGLRVPLSYDRYLLRTAQGIYLMGFQTGLGVLNAEGDAQVHWEFKPGLWNNMIGHNLWLAVVTYHPQEGVLDRSSMNVCLEILPGKRSSKQSGT